MKPGEQKQLITQAAKTYANTKEFDCEEHVSAIIFHDIENNFNEDSFNNIKRNPIWDRRLNKPHTKVKKAKEMQSSNSSDALLMNIFCYPNITKCKGFKKLIGDCDIIEFGYKANIKRIDQTNDSTEIDLKLSGALCEAKLTEEDFTSREASIVERYNLDEVFHVDALPRVGDKYDNYQIIRNLLAAKQHKKDHILFCDERRPDLVRRYLETVICLKDIEQRKRCRVIFWQEIARVCPTSLKTWLKDKYDIQRERLIINSEHY